MNSTCRSIDLATNMIAPIAVGQVMYFLSHIAAAVTIASWNVLSFFIECFLLWRIYKEFPNLAVKTAVTEKQPLKGTLRVSFYFEDLDIIWFFNNIFRISWERCRTRRSTDTWWQHQNRYVFFTREIGCNKFRKKLLMILEKTFSPNVLEDSYGVGKYI